MRRVSDELPDDVAAVAARVTALDDASMATSVDAWAAVRSPRFGKIEGLGIWLSGVQRAAPPRPLTTKVVVVAGDPGPDDVVRLLADLAGAQLRCAELSMTSGNMAIESSLSHDDTIAALRAGIAIADAAIDSGADVVVLAERSEPSSVAAAIAIVAAVTGGEPVDLVGRGAGDAAWGRTVAVVRDALRRGQVSPLEPLRLLTELAGAEIVAMSGVLVAAAARRTPVVLDGLVPTAAALVAALLAPGAEAFWVAAHRTPDPAHVVALAHLRLEPLLDLGIAHGEGVGALLALPLLDAAATLHPR